MVCIVVTLVLVTFTGTPSSAQSGEQSTIEALQTENANLQGTVDARGDRMNAQRTQIADLETEVAGGSVATEEPAGDEAQGGGASPYLFGPGVELLPAGTSGEVEVVLQGVYDGNILPLIVRNNTDEPIGRVQVTGSARSAAGDLIAAGGDQGFNPSRVEPGSYALGYLYFDGAALPADATFEFNVSYSAPESGSFSSIDMTVIEATFLGDRIVGTLQNNHDVEMSGPIDVSIICLDAGGAILGHEQGFTDQDTVPAGESIPFQVSFFGGIDCTYFALASSGYSF
jgi:hypothetical protein